MKPTIDYSSIIDERLKLLDKAKDDVNLQKIEMSLCSDPEDGILYRFDNYVYTDKNASLFDYEDPDILPFIPFEFQKEAIKEIRKSIRAGTLPIQERKKYLTNVFIEKSRQMGLSWIIMGILVYGFTFHNHKYHCVSQSEKDVDKSGDMRSLFEKARFILNNLPERMRPEWYSTTKWKPWNTHLILSRSDGVWAITGEAAHQDASRSWTYNAVFMDEMAFMAYGTEIARAAWQASPCCIYNSTPNWEGNEFYRKRKMAIWTIDHNWMSVAPTIKWLRYHRKEHPLYDDARFERKTKGKDEQEIAQELEINYNVAIIWRVYNDFPAESMFSLKYDYEKPLFVIIDNSHWWADPHAVILAQIDNHFIDVIDACEFHCSVDDMADLMRWEIKFKLTNMQEAFMLRYAWYAYQKATFISDPYDTNATVNDATIYDKYKKRWIYLRTPNERSKIIQIRNAKSNIYRIRYTVFCQDYASALMNAKYPERPENTKAVNPAMMPVHDRTSHFRSGTEYMIQYFLENPLLDKPRVIEDNRPKRDPITRRLTYPTKHDNRERRDPVTRKLIR